MVRRIGPAAIVVLAKFPVPGRVKTRLAVGIGADLACALQRAFLRDLAVRLGRTAIPVWWAYTPRDAPFAGLVRSARAFAQPSGDLGRRVTHALGRVRREGHGAVLAIGADTPHVPLREVHRGVEALRDGTDVVLGPARDGGYYVIGLRAPQPALFRDVPWSTSGVLEITRERCRRLGLTLVELAPTFDVDVPADLVALRRWMRRHPGELRHTARVLRAHRRGPFTRRSGSPRPAASPSSDCVRR